jgi:geranylgeranyl diphosphate synthase type II
LGTKKSISIPLAISIPMKRELKFDERHKKRRMMTDTLSSGTTRTAFELQPYIESRRSIVDSALLNYLQRSRHDDAEILAAMAYSIEAGGKRLRPILCMATTHALGGSEAEALPVGCALEMIHTYSLIHDDLPAMDNDDVRRGKPTSHKAFNEATAILAGDALLTCAFQLLAEHALQEPAHHNGQWLKVIALIAGAAGHHGMIEGQMRDIAAEGRELTLDELEQLHLLKTGALISAAIESGAILGRADANAYRNLKEYGRCIGLAFQVADDILNEVGNPEIMGKAVGTDRLRRKNTYPALLGLSAARQKAAELVNQALRSLDIFDTKSDPLRAIARYVVERHR